MNNNNVHSLNKGCILVNFPVNQHENKALVQFTVGSLLLTLPFTFSSFVTIPTTSPISSTIQTPQFKWNITYCNKFQILFYVCFATHYKNIKILVFTQNCLHDFIQLPHCMMHIIMLIVKFDFLYIFACVRQCLIYICVWVYVSCLILEANGNGMFLWWCIFCHNFAFPFWFWVS